MAEHRARLIYHFSFSLVWSVVGVAAADGWVTALAFVATTGHIFACLWILTHREAPDA